VSNWTGKFPVSSSAHLLGGGGASSSESNSEPLLGGAAASSSESDSDSGTATKKTRAQVKYPEWAAVETHCTAWQRQLKAMIGKSGSIASFKQAMRNTVNETFPRCKDGRGTARKFAAQMDSLAGKLHEKQVSDHGTKVDPQSEAAAKERRKAAKAKGITLGPARSGKSGEREAKQPNLAEMRDQRVIRAEAAELRAKEARRRQALLGARVRVQCTEGFFDGTVDSWDDGLREFLILLDDGAPLPRACLLPCC